MKKILSVLLAFVVLCSAIASVSISAFAATKMTLTAPKSMYTYRTSTIKVKVKNKDVSYKKCTFSSSNKKIATVSSKGVITAKKAGTVKITVKLKSNKKVKKTVTVKINKNVLSTKCTELTFVKGCSNSLYVYNNGSRVTTSLVYSSSNNNVATVSKSGVVSAKNVGTAVISYYPKNAKGLVKKIIINVVDPRDNNGVLCFNINPNTLPINGNYLSYVGDDSIRSYYLIRSYLELFEKMGGGYLYLDAGTYVIPWTLPIPSNTTIEFSPNAYVSKILKSSYKLGTLFELCEPSKMNTKGAYNLHNGVHDVNIIGNGATIDMNCVSTFRQYGITMCHNKNVQISNLNFINLVDGHFFEIDATENVSVTNCTFKNQVTLDINSSSECINIDTPDKKTEGFVYPWTAYDCTPNENLTISNCTFSNVQRGIGSHQYSGGKYHNNINITSNYFENCRDTAVSMVNWTNVNFTYNYINGSGRDVNGNNLLDEKTRALIVSGCSKANISNNVFRNCYEAMRFYPKKNASHLDSYPATYNDFSLEEYEGFAKDNYYVYDGAFTKDTMYVFYECDEQTGATLSKPKKTFKLTEYKGQI